jgi:hypothetical protein
MLDAIEIPISLHVTEGRRAGLKAVRQWRDERAGGSGDVARPTRLMGGWKDDVLEPDRETGTPSPSP